MSSDEIRLRRVARNLYYRKRHLAATSNEQVEAREMKKGLQIMMVMVAKERRSRNTDQGKLRRLKKYLKIMIVQYIMQNIEDPDDLPAQPSRRCRIQDFHPSVCKTFFRFKQGGLYKLYELLRIPAIVRFANRSKMSGEEVLLRGLFELATGMNQEIACITVFGGVQSDQSRAFTYFINRIYDEHEHLVHDNLEWWFGTGFMAESADLISGKMGYETTVCCFIDCNCLTTSVTGGGPAEAGANAIRWSDMVQRAFYNGWKSTHGRFNSTCSNAYNFTNIHHLSPLTSPLPSPLPGLKHQTVDNAWGMTVDMYGPTSLRRYDTTLLGLSDINDRFARVQAGDEHQFQIFGDSAYKLKSHTRSYFKAQEMVHDWMLWNMAMKSVRISIEWNYGYRAALFKYIQRVDKLKIMKPASVSRVYTVCTLLHNFYSILYGNQSTNYFNSRFKADVLDHYINGTMCDMDGNAL
jgi:Fe-S-cluster containining protein